MDDRVFGPWSGLAVRLTPRTVAPELAMSITSPDPAKRSRSRREDVSPAGSGRTDGRPQVQPGPGFARGVDDHGRSAGTSVPVARTSGRPASTPGREAGDARGRIDPRPERPDRPRRRRGTGPTVQSAASASVPTCIERADESSPESSPDRRDPHAILAHLTALLEEASAAGPASTRDAPDEAMESCVSPASATPQASGDSPVTAPGRGRRHGGRSRSRRQRLAGAVASAVQREAFELPLDVPSVRTGWPAIDEMLAVRGSTAPGLARGVLHEWCAVEPDEADVASSSQTQSRQSGRRPGRSSRVSSGAPCRDWSDREPVTSTSAPTRRGEPVPQPGMWVPPMAILAHLADRAAASAAEAGSGGVVVWIGHRAWPAPSLPAARRHLDRSIYIDPPDEASRIWAIDLAMRCPAVAAVVADGTGLSMAATRRLQLAARAGRALTLLVRPPWERGVLSASATRWQVQPEHSVSDEPRWRVRLTRCKAMGQSVTGGTSVGLTVGMPTAGTEDGAVVESSSAGTAMAPTSWSLEWSGVTLELMSQEASTPDHQGTKPWRSMDEDSTHERTRQPAAPDRHGRVPGRTAEFAGERARGGAPVRSRAVESAA